MWFLVFGLTVVPLHTFTKHYRLCLLSLIPPLYTPPPSPPHPIVSVSPSSRLRRRNNNHLGCTPLRRWLPLLQGSNRNTQWTSLFQSTLVSTAVCEAGRAAIAADRITFPNISASVEVSHTASSARGSLCTRDGTFSIISLMPPSFTSPLTARHLGSQINSCSLAGRYSQRIAFECLEEKLSVWLHRCSFQYFRIRSEGSRISDERLSHPKHPSLGFRNPSLH